MQINISPNPVASNVVKITYTLENREKVSCQVYDATGRIVRTLQVQEQNAGKHTINWDRKDDNGLSVNAGVYFIKLETETGYSQAKVIVAN